MWKLDKKLKNRIFIDLKFNLLQQRKFFKNKIEYSMALMFSPSTIAGLFILGSRQKLQAKISHILITRRKK